MEARFGADFSAVRVHDDARAAESARAVDAHAYAVGSDLVFGAGRYAPGTASGDRLLAHELAHTLQQGGVARRLQRACGPAAIGAAPPTCNLMSVPLPLERFRFNVNCDEFETGEEARLRALAHVIPTTASVSVVGMASSEGATGFNDALSCRRAEAGRAVLASEGVTASSVTATGPVPGTAGNPDVRAVGIDLTEPEFHLPKCGPDVTDWFVTQVGLAMADPAVLAIQRDMADADAMARRHGTTAAELAEGGAGAAVLAMEISLGSSAPARNPTITRQIGRSVPGGAAAAALAASVSIDAAFIVHRLARAAAGWRALVNHGARYDFKAHVMHCPRTSGCSDQPACNCSVTFCPSDPMNMCFVFDTPGNLFYALIGKFVGFSELTLQLGSQLAQLTGTASWDPPEDTEAIRVGFSLPLPLTAANLCSTLVPERLNINFRRGCGNCSEPTTAGFR
jgi:outer membrane protein OmpA-like peptidoglycan-associated protein